MLTYQERLIKKYPRANDPIVKQIKSVRDAIWELQRKLNLWDPEDGMTHTHYRMVDSQLMSADINYVENRPDECQFRIETSIRLASEFNLTIPGLAELAESQA